MRTTSISEASRADAPWRDVLAQLDAYLASARHRCLLWVDPAQADPFADNELVEELRVRVPIRHPRFDMRRAPYMVPLDLAERNEADLFRSSVELAWLSWSTEYLKAMHGQPICGWVSTGMGAKAVARHWAANCHLHIFQRQNRLLRFQDPGVREWLWRSLDKIQQQALMGPAIEIVSIGRTQELVHHGLHSDRETLDSFPRLHIQQAQWNQIDDYAALHAAWLDWRRSTTDTATVAKEAGWECSILRALAQASDLGIRDAVDRELFALHALQLGHDFHRSATLDEVWQKTRTGEFYGSAVESVTGRPADQLASWLQAPSDSSNESEHVCQH